ncbi:hypothetical protein ACQ4PT_028051 [Festuca glaucescens]
MASISTHDDAAAATSHVENAPAPAPKLDREESADAGKGTAAAKETIAEEEQAAAARRDVFLLAGIRKLIKSFRSLSHIFEIYKDEEEEEEDGMDIQIGFPTDVQHVAHIGLDGSSNVASLRGMEGAARDLLSLSTNLSLQQFDFAMASLAAHDDRNAALARN